MIYFYCVDAFYAFLSGIYSWLELRSSRCYFRSQLKFLKSLVDAYLKYVDFCHITCRHGDHLFGTSLSAGYSQLNEYGKR